MTISVRLNTLLNMVDETAVLADIGADHGLLCVAAVQRGKCRRAVAADISAKSLKKAQANIAAAGLSEVIDLRVGDGLAVLDNPADVCICGMGGLVMAGILERGKTRLGRAAYLAPNNAEHLVRAKTVELGYVIVDEDIVLENGRYYQLIKAVRGESGALNDAELEFGPINLQRDGENLAGLLEKRLKDALKMERTALRSDSERSRRALYEARRRIETYRGLTQWLSQ